MDLEQGAGERSPSKRQLSLSVPLRRSLHLPAALVPEGLPRAVGRWGGTGMNSGQATCDTRRFG